jgi:F-type H+-transporting ATPase subunit b
MAEAFHIELAQAEPAPPATQGGQGAITESPGEHKVFPPFDATTFASQLFWFAITFLLFYWLMSKVVLPRIGDIIATRRDRIAGDMAEAERARASSEEAAAAYEKELAEARAGANRIAEEARSQAKAETDSRRAAIESDLAMKLAAAEQRIGEIKSKALADVGAIAGEAAEAVVKALADVNVTAREVSDAVGNAMNERGSGV